MKEVKFSRKYYPLFLVIPLSSLLYYIKRMDSIEVVLSFILYVAVSFILMVLLWEFISLIDSRYDIKKLSVTAVTAAVLVILDQLIKLVLYYNTGFETGIFGRLFMIKQTHNINQTGLFNFLNIEITQAHAIIFKTVILAVIICFYWFCKTEMLKKSLTLLIAAAAANILDSVFYGYTLDYIHFYRITTYDLKDFYVDAGVSAFILCILINENNKSKIKNKKEF